MSHALDSLFLGLEQVCADTLGKEMYFVPLAQFNNNRATLAIPNTIPAEWLAITVVETFLTGGADQISTGLLEGPDLLSGEAPASRSFIAIASLFTEPPTIDDRLIVKATGQNLAISSVDPVYELGDVLMTYRLNCREL